MSPHPPSDTTVATSKSPGPSPSKKEAEVVSKAMEFLISGKRNLLVQDVSGATTALEEACRLLGEQFGETGRECGEAYFYYGKALLELARMESGVIDNAFDGVQSDEDEANDSRIGNPNDVTEGEAQKISDEVDDALIENCQELESIKKKDANGKKEGAKEEEKTNGDVSKKESEEKEKDVEMSEEEDKGTEEKKEEKDVEIIKKEKDDELKEKNKDDEKNEKEKDVEMKENGHKESEDSKEDDEEDEAENEDEESEDKDEGEAEEKNKDKMKDEETKETESIGSNDAGTSEIKDGKDKDAVEKEEEDDPSNLQLSWEMLELAKSIFQKHADSIEDPKDDQRIELETKLCEVYQLLGEVSIENENYEQAVEDLNSCLRRREELLPSDSRSIAETHYQLGVALGFNLRFDDAVVALESSISVLNSRVQNLKNKSESQDPSKKDDALFTREREVEEIEKLIPEIKEKIVDTRDMQEETRKKIKEGGLGAFESSNQSNNDNDKPVSNITNLVKKRKKSGENANGEEPTKKPHLEENGTNGVKATNGNSEAKTNGKVETSA